MWVTFLPMVFMFVTTFTASWELLDIFRQKTLTARSSAEALTFKIDAFLIFLMAALAIIVLTDMTFKLFRHFFVKMEAVKSDKIS